MSKLSASDKAILEYVKPLLDEKTSLLGRLASSDLRLGPITYCEACGADNLADCACEIRYPGFEKACAVVSDWVDNLDAPLFVEDWSGCVLDKEPEGEWVNQEGEPCDESDEGAEFREPESPFYRYDRKDLARVVFGSDLVEYL